MTACKDCGKEIEGMREGELYCFDCKALRYMEQNWSSGL